MAITTHQVIYLGTFADADTDEASASVENPSVYLQTFGSAGSPLIGALEPMSFDDADNNGSIETNNFATSDSTSGAGGTAQLDSLAVVNVTVTYADSSTATFGSVVMFQNDNGELFLSNSNYAGTDLRDPDGEAIQSITVNSITSTNYTSLLQNNFQNFTCFAAGTQIATAGGPRAIEGLNVGDLVQTTDSGLQEIRWIGASTVLAMGRMAPVRIAKGAMGGGLPIADLYVSQHHRMILSSPIVARMTGKSDVFVSAKTLVGLPGIELAPRIMPITYYHILFDHHEVVAANGAPTETLWPGEQAFEMLGPEHNRALRAVVGPDFGPPARLVLTGHKRRQAIARHAKNNKPLLCNWVWPQPELQLAG